MTEEQSASCAAENATEATVEATTTNDEVKSPAVAAQASVDEAKFDAEAEAAGKAATVKDNPLVAIQHLAKAATNSTYTARSLAAVPADGTTMQPTSVAMIQSAIERNTVGATGVVAECNLNIGVDFSCSTKQELASYANANVRATGGVAKAEALAKEATTQEAKVTADAEGQAETPFVEQAEASFVKAATVSTRVRFDGGTDETRALEAMAAQVDVARDMSAAQAVAKVAFADKLSVDTRQAEEVVTNIVLTAKQPIELSENLVQQPAGPFPENLTQQPTCAMGSLTMQPASSVCVFCSLTMEPARAMGSLTMQPARPFRENLVQQPVSAMGSLTMQLVSPPGVTMQHASPVCESRIACTEPNERPTCTIENAAHRQIWNSFQFGDRPLGMPTTVGEIGRAHV